VTNVERKRVSHTDIEAWVDVKKSIKGCIKDITPIYIVGAVVVYSWLLADIRLLTRWGKCQILVSELVETTVLGCIRYAGCSGVIERHDLREQSLLASKISAVKKYLY
jgi:hypothetical protein